MGEHDDTTYEARDQEPTAALPVSPWGPISLLLGVAALGTFAVDDIGGLIAIAGIISGHVARREIKAGVKGGNGWAVAGLILCYFLLIAGIVGRFVAAQRS